MLALAAFGCRPVRSPDPVILTLGDHVVRRSEFERHLQTVATRSQVGMTPDVRRALLESYLEERVLVLEARERGLLKEDASPVEEMEGTRQLLQSAAAEVPPVSSAEVSSYFAAHQADLGQPERVTVRQIVLPTPNEARDVRRRLQKDPKQFEALAQTRSRAPEASAGGLMGTFAPGELPTELAKAAFALAPGQTSEVVPSPLGYHVLRLDARQEAREATLETAQEEIRKRLLQQKAETRVREFVRGLLARAKVNHEAANAPQPS